MSWLKRRSPAAPSPGPAAPPVQMYNPNQHQDWQQSNNWYSQQQHVQPPTNDYQQQQQPNYWQQPTYQAPAGNMQQPTYYQTQYDQQTGYYQQQNNAPVYSTDYNMYQGQQNQQNDAWNWGDNEDNSNAMNANSASNTVAQDSFVNDESWNWNVDDSASTTATTTTTTASSSSTNVANNEDKVPVFPKIEDIRNSSKQGVPDVDNFEHVADRKMMKAQWSTESQESSDDVLQTSESRSSTVSHSPLSGAQTPLEVKRENSEIVKEEVYEVKHSVKVEPSTSPTVVAHNPPVVQTPPIASQSPPIQSANTSYAGNQVPPTQTPNTYAHTTLLQGPSNVSYPPPSKSATPPTIYQNVSQPQPIKSKTPPTIYQQPQNVSQNMPSISPQPTVNIPQNNLPQTFPNKPQTPPIVSNNTTYAPFVSQPSPTVSQVASNASIAPPTISHAPPTMSQASSVDNPYKRGVGPLSHKNMNKSRGAERFSQSVNLETPPDNAEQPDNLQAPRPAIPSSTLHPIQSNLPDNNEVAPINERDQYLETGQLSDETMRMVLGQEPSSTLSQQPPSGLSRMVLGQNTSRPLHRMVPGESSPPNYPPPPSQGEEEESENEELDRLSANQPPRSATIGADTPTPTDSAVVQSEIEELTSGVNNLSVEQEINPLSDNDKKGSPSRRRYRDRRYEDDDRPRRRRYEDDEDYYSDRDRRVDRREYGDRMPTKDRRRRERDYYQHRRDDYYYEGYDDEQRSRPSSRSDSVQDSTYGGRSHDVDYHHQRRRRDHRERDHRRPNRQDPFSSYMQGYGYDPYNPYFQQYQYQYLENMRRTNPQAYAEWYRKYYQVRGGGATEDRTSVASGRSSANEEVAKDRYSQSQRYYGQNMSGYYQPARSISGQYGIDDSRAFDYTDSSLNLEDSRSSIANQRLTPVKFSTAHVRASITSGNLVKILPHYPTDGQNALVEIERLNADYLPGDDEYRELSEFPGPLIRGVTHKKTVIEYCESKIRKIANQDSEEDPDSCILMWELLILLLRQNGMVVGTDIAELLLKNQGNPEQNIRPSSVLSNSSSSVGMGVTTDMGNKEEAITNKFREYLLYGSGKEALEWAMKHGLWGHALFLASKLDKRTYANVMMRFANGLPMNDPLQTLYQLLSGRLPAAVTSVHDERWGDWRPHLAMILSNTTQRPEMDRKAIMTLADTLMSRGSSVGNASGLYAAQFCYLMAEVNFSRFGTESAKLVLLGADHLRSTNFNAFATNEAIHMTEIYEYARSLNDPEFNIPEFQAYKYLLATRLADRGFLETSLSYLEQVSLRILGNPSAAQPSLINRVCELSERLKYYDPVGEELDDDGAIIDLNSSRPDNSWLKDLKLIQQEYNMGLITHESVANLNTATPDIEYLQQQPLGVEQTTGEEHWQGQQELQSLDYHQQWQPEQQTTTPLESDVYQQQQQYQQQEQQQYWNQQQQQAWDQTEQHHQQEGPQDYWANNQVGEDVSRPQISMPNQSKSTHFDEANDDLASAPKKHDSPAKNTATSPKKPPAPASSGWFGGIWNRLALRPKNQMKLPDDKNPSIVWDQEKKRWVNLEEDSNEASTELKPPPKMSDMAAPAPIRRLPEVAQTVLGVPASAPEAMAPPPSAQPNMFKMQRSRNLKKSYVDVFNPDGKATVPSMIPTDGFIPASSNLANSQRNFFIPAPVTDANAPMDFLTPANSIPPDAQVN